MIPDTTIQDQCGRLELHASLTRRAAPSYRLRLFAINIDGGPSRIADIFRRGLAFRDGISHDAVGEDLRHWGRKGRG